MSNRNLIRKLKHIAAARDWELWWNAEKQYWVLQDRRSMCSIDAGYELVCEAWFLICAEELMTAIHEDALSYDIYRYLKAKYREV